MTEESPLAPHTMFSISMHICRITKYRYKVLKGKTSSKLQIECLEFKNFTGVIPLGLGLLFETGNVIMKMVEEYIKHHFEGEDGRDSFSILEPFSLFQLWALLMYSGRIN